MLTLTGSTLAGKAYHPVNGSEENVWEGFSWPCLLFGPLWFISKGMWGWALIASVCAVFTAGFSMIVFPFVANALRAKALVSQGYLNEDQWRNRNKPAPPPVSAPPPPLSPPVAATGSVADELQKLVALREQGVLTEDEFTELKKRLLR